MQPLYTHRPPFKHNQLSSVLGMLDSTSCDITTTNELFTWLCDNFTMCILNMYALTQTLNVLNKIQGSLWSFDPYRSLAVVVVKPSAKRVLIILQGRTFS